MTTIPITMFGGSMDESPQADKLMILYLLN
jgi:hypothetical protein